MSDENDVYLVPLESGFLVPFTEKVSLVDIHENQTVASEFANLGLRGLTRRKIAFYKKYGVCNVPKVQELLRRYNEHNDGQRPFDLLMELINESYSVLKPLLPSEWFHIQQCSTVTSSTHKLFLRMFSDTINLYGDERAKQQAGKYSKLLALANAMRTIDTGDVDFREPEDSSQDEMMNFDTYWCNLFGIMMEPSNEFKYNVDTRYIHLFLNTIFRGKGDVYAV